MEKDIIEIRHEYINELGMKVSCWNEYDADATIHLTEYDLVVNSFVNFLRQCSFTEETIQKRIDVKSYSKEW